MRSSISFLFPPLYYWPLASLGNSHRFDCIDIGNEQGKDGKDSREGGKWHTYPGDEVSSSHLTLRRSLIWACGWLLHSEWFVQFPIAAVTRSIIIWFRNIEIWADNLLNDIMLHTLFLKDPLI